MWSARDALVLKWVALKLAPQLPFHDHCLHIKGRGGRHKSIKEVAQALQNGCYRFVFRTDVKGYYQHIIKEQVFWHIKQHISCPVLTEIVRQYLWYSVEYGGEIYTPETGISRGCSLSPLIGGSLLYHVDYFFSQVFSDTYYARYMDDFIILTSTRNRLRQNIRYMNDFFHMRGFEKHPDKTVIGKISGGFDWLGMDFDQDGIRGVSYRSIQKHRETCLRKYLCSVRHGDTEEEALKKINQYKRHWRKSLSGLLCPEIV